MVYAPTHWEEAGRISPQGGLKVDGAADKEEDTWYVGATPTGGVNDGGGPT